MPTLGRFSVDPEIAAISGMVDEYAEFDIIAHLIQRPENARAILDVVFNAMFTSTARGQIFESAAKLVLAGADITPTSILIQARENAILFGEQCEVEEEGLLRAKKFKLGDLDSSIRMVANTWGQRQYMKVIQWGAEMLGAGKTEGFAAEMRERLDKVLIPPRVYKELMSGSDVADLTLSDQDLFTQRYDSGMVADLSWPWASMADAPPILPNWFVILAGLDGGMKTAFAECYAEKICMRKTNGRSPHCLYVHTEYGSSMMRQRRLTRWSGVPLDRLLIGNTSPQERKEVGIAVEKMREFPGLKNLNYLHYSPEMSPLDVLNHALKAHRDGTLDLMILDYFNNVPISTAMLRENGGDINRAISAMSRLFQAFCEATGVPIIMIAQFTKEGMKTVEGGKSASPSGISGPAAWMQRAQQQIILHRPIIMFPNSDLIVDPKTGENVKCGQVGKRSSILDVTFAKATVGEPGLYQLHAIPQKYMVSPLSKGSMRL